MDEFNPPPLVEDKKGQAASENMALLFKHEFPEEVERLRRHMEERCGPITDKELDRLLLLYAEHAWLGVEPGEL